MWRCSEFGCDGGEEGEQQEVWQENTSRPSITSLELVPLQIHSSVSIIEPIKHSSK